MAHLLLLLLTLHHGHLQQYSAGNVTQVGPALNPMDGTGDLGTIDSTRGVFFYLGDTSGGATLVGLSMQDGTISCSVHVPLREISFVGIGTQRFLRPLSVTCLSMPVASMGILLYFIDIYQAWKQGFISKMKRPTAADPHASTCHVY